MHLLGYYSVNDRIFTSKIEAVIEASKLDTYPKYHYYDRLWDYNINRFTYNSEVNLLDLYKLRAQQIRDNYDYLVLYFSGGVDSATILDTFLENNIRLDEICVKWPKTVLGSSIYTPNNTDTSATNMLSEWDFAIKPKLDYVRAKYPEIKITIIDWTETINSVKIDYSLLLKQNHNFSLANFTNNESVSPDSISLENNGKKVGHIYGADKPVIVYLPGDNSYNMIFRDNSIMCAGPQHALDKIELNNIMFYYAVDFPELTLARAYKAVEFIKKSKALIDSITFSITNSAETRHLKKLATDKLLNSVLYPNWDNSTFQVSKSSEQNKVYNSWYSYIFTAPEFSEQQHKLRKVLDEFNSSISHRFKSVSNTGEMLSITSIRTKMFKLKEIQ